MRYEPPVGATDPNAPYVARNLATGSSVGSRAPAAAMENPQRELLAVIDAGLLTPAAGDLTQVAQAIARLSGNPIVLSPVAPSLHLDCIEGFTPPSGSFSRLSSGYRIRASGLLESVASGAIRIQHAADTGIVTGALCEEARTNVLLQSEQFDNASWSKSNCTITANAGAAPDGTTTADKFIPSAGVIGYATQPATITAGTTYTYSCHARQAELTGFMVLLPSALFASGGNRSVSFNLAAKTITYSGVVAAEVSALLQEMANGNFRCIVTFTAGASISSGIQFVRSLSNGDGTSGLFVWGAQLETGASATTYIATTTAAVTRAADSFAVPVATSWYNASEWTMVVSARVPRALPPVWAVLFELSDGSANNRVVAYIGNSGQAVVAQIVGGVTIEQLTLGVVAPGAAIRVAVSSKTGSLIASRDGEAVQTAAPASRPAGLTTLAIGGDTSNLVKLNAPMRRLAFIPRALVAAHLQKLSAAA